MAGFGSHNKFALIGGMRAAAQIISYEIPQILAVLIPSCWRVPFPSTRSLKQQSGLFGLGWFIFTSPSDRLPFCLICSPPPPKSIVCRLIFPKRNPNSSQAITPNISGMKFGLFYLAEFLNAFLISAVAASIFFGGWQGPFVHQIPALGIAYFFGKTIVLIGVQLWFRGTLPRIRVDQLMNFGWKRLVPVTLGLIIFTAATLWLWRGVMSF